MTQQARSAIGTLAEAKALAPIVLLLSAAMVLGGSARAEMAGTMALRPLAALLLGYGLCRVRADETANFRFVIAVATAIAALPALQLVPLPYDAWTRLPGRDLVAAIDAAAGLGRIARPLSLAPDATLNALLSLLVPLAVLALGLGLDARQRRHLLPVLLVLGAASAMLGLGQIAGGPDSQLYLYDFTNPGSAVGLFANRNHAAMMLAMMLPMLAVFGLQYRKRQGHAQAMAVLGGLVLLPLVLITGSRAGLLLAGFGLLATPFVLAPALTWQKMARQQVARQGMVIALGLVLIAGLAFATVQLGRAEAWNRLLSDDAGSDARFRILPTLLAEIARQFPWGSGIGSFEPVFKAIEPDHLLSPAYMNHAHDDWLEAVMTGGAPALLLLLLTVTAFALTLYRSATRPAADRAAACYGRLGLVLVAMAGLGSLGDYPLRTPALAAVFVVAVLWAGEGRTPAHSARGAA